jgi:hypothetical protein
VPVGVDDIVLREYAIRRDQVFDVAHSAVSDIRSKNLAIMASTAQRATGGQIP